MKPKSSHSPSQRFSFTSQRWWRVLQTTAIGLCLIIASCLIINLLKLAPASSHPTDALLVLGGSIRREIYTAQLAKQHHQIPILISRGSPDPCVWLIFQQQATPLENVWLEKCAQSTFDNFYFSLPILQRWRVHKVKLITSSTHLPRAKWLAQIILGAHGIWVETETAPEIGIPGNTETSLKAALDVTRSLVWAIVSQLIQPHCSDVTKLVEVDIAAWQSRGFHCERQGNL